MNTKPYRPGTHKLMHHLDHLQKMAAGEIVAPLHVSIWPTIRCQFRCEYCCCKDEDHDQPDLRWRDFITAIDALAARGAMAVEFSGGGEPLLWPQICEGITYARDKGMKVSLITNGLILSDIPEEILKKIAWIRVSLQSVEHADDVDFKYVQEHTKVSASVIYSPEIDFEILHEIMKAKNIVTRIAAPQPNAGHIDYYARNVAELYGDPFFFAEKEKGIPSACYMAWIRAAIDWTGHFLPCPSVMLAGGDKKVLGSFRLCHVSGLGKWLDEHRVKDLGFRCDFCNCGKEHNEFIHDIFEEIENDEFI
jgi:organic radical activating enzyme